ncbi:MAG: hypothetical protein IJI25_09375 [Eubacterium sp.]|jgi:hypothetical protein|nr:hypothetical protein [Eubacterium sp.]
MKYQFIKTIFGISLAVCTAYSALRSAYTTVAMPGTESVTERSTVSTEEYAEMPEPEEGDDTSDRGNSGEGEDINSIESEQDSGDTDEYYVEPDQGSEQAEVSLADFLAGLRCGACGRNCSLLAPHCRNGMFKAQQAEQEYYEMYGG